MNFVLDTNICIYWLKGNDNIEQRSLAVGLNNIAISFITLSELYYGAYKSKRVKENLSTVRSVTNKLGFIESSNEICETFGRLKTSLEKKGRVVDDADLFIAACALVNDATLVTNNEKHFRRIKGLKLENWV